MGMLLPPRKRARRRMVAVDKAIRKLLMTDPQTSRGEGFLAALLSLSLHWCWRLWTTELPAEPKVRVEAQSLSAQCVCLSDCPFAAPKMGS